jgi:hypothetical protein
MEVQLFYQILALFDSAILSWLLGMLLVSRSGLVEEDAGEVFHYYGFHLSSSFLIQF